MTAGSGDLAADALRWHASGAEEPPESIAKYNTYDQELLYRAADACDPEVRDRILSGAERAGST